MKKILIVMICLLLVGCSGKKPNVLEEDGVEIRLISYEDNGKSLNTLVFTQDETYIVYFFDDQDKVSAIMFLDNVMGMLGYAYLQGVDADSSAYFLILTGEEYKAFLKEKSISLEEMNTLVENYFSSNEDKITIVYPVDEETSNDDSE